MRNQRKNGLQGDAPYRVTFRDGRTKDIWAQDLQEAWEFGCLWGMVSGNDCEPIEVIQIFGRTDLIKKVGPQCSVTAHTETAGASQLLAAGPTFKTIEIRGGKYAIQ